MTLLVPPVFEVVPLLWPTKVPETVAVLRIT